MGCLCCCSDHVRYRVAKNAQALRSSCAELRPSLWCALLSLLHQAAGRMRSRDIERLRRCCTATELRHVVRCGSPMRTSIPSCNGGVGQVMSSRRAGCWCSRASSHPTTYWVMNPGPSIEPSGAQYRRVSVWSSSSVWLKVATESERVHDNVSSRGLRGKLEVQWLVEGTPLCGVCGTCAQCLKLVTA